MSAATTLLLVPGATIVLDGLEWAVESVQPQYGRVLLRRGPGQRCEASMRALVAQCAGWTSPGAGPVSDGRQPALLSDLPPYRQELVCTRFAHVQEAETGYRSGDPLRALPGEPRAPFDPATTTLAQRRRAKAAELAALGEQARLLGFDAVSERTLRRLAVGCRRFGVLGCVDERWLRPRGPRRSICEPVREAILAVHAESLHRSRLSMKTRHRLVHQYVREKFGAEVAVPCYQTLRSVWIEWFGPGGTRQRYARSAARLEPSGEHVVVHRPGQVVALDTTVLPVQVRETVFGEPVAAHLTLAMDVYTHSLVAFRITLVSDTSVDVAMLLRDVMMPLPLRADWGEDMEWPYPGIPAAVVAEFAGYRVAGLPFFAPETVTTDHGSVYKNHHLIDVQRIIGANVLPSRVLRPTDKHALERAFGGARSLLFELLPGYTGVDVADRGADPCGDAILTVEAMEQLVATWIVKIWQNRRLGEYAPAWDPAGEHSPNTLFAAAMAQGGFTVQVPAPQLYYELLPAHHVKIHGRRGVKIRGLWYDGPGLDDYRDGPSTRGGRHKGTWVIRRDPRDVRFVFFQNPTTGDWHTLRWNGLPPDDEVPAFTDARARQLLAQVRQAGLRPRNDAELLPMLLELIGQYSPVDQWPTQLSGHDRSEQARQAAQTAAAATDRPATDRPVTDRPVTACETSQDASVLPLRPAGPARQIERAVDADRRRRREAAATGRPQPPPLLGEALRRGGLFVLPDDDDPGGARRTEDER